jgi:hypothetical protein
VLPSPRQHPRARCSPNCLASLVPTALSPSPKPTVVVRVPRPSLSGRLRRHEHDHGERRPSSPLAVLRPWSVELTLPSLLTVAGPPPATVAPPRRRNAAAEPDFFSSPSPPLWCPHRPRRDARPGVMTAPACAALRRDVVGRAGQGRPSERRPRPRGRGSCASATRVGRAVAAGVGQAPLCIWAECGFGAVAPG